MRDSFKVVATNPVQDLYTQKAKLYERFFVELLQWGKALDAFFEANACLRPGMKILDAGCGTGIVTRVLYRLAQRKGIEPIDFHAFDLTPAMLGVFRQWIEAEGAKGIELQAADALELEEQLPEGWSGYDLIVSSTMLEYIPKEKLDLALGNLKRLLNREGRLLVLVTRQTRLTRWGAARWWRTNLFEREELERLLDRVGFTSIQEKRLPGSWNSFILAIETGEVQGAT